MKAIVAAVQMESGDDPRANRARAKALVEEAARRGARVIALPENALDERVPPPVDDLAAVTEDFGSLARSLGVSLLLGTVRELASGDARPYQTTLVLDARGGEVHRYRKVHLFDVDVPGGTRERESASLRPGSSGDVRAFDLDPIGRAGVGICYDLRFPELWRKLVQDGARTLFVPASFALQTGKDHWHVLLRARAIENLAFVVAPAQVGAKPGGRVRYGHALVVDPWGNVLADAGGEGEGLAIAELDFEKQERARRALPCLEHRKL